MKRFMSFGVPLIGVFLLLLLASGVAAGPSSHGYPGCSVASGVTTPQTGSAIAKDMATDAKSGEHSLVAFAPAPAQNGSRDQLVVKDRVIRNSTRGLERVSIVTRNDKHATAFSRGRIRKTFFT